MDDEGRPALIDGVSCFSLLSLAGLFSIFRLPVADGGLPLFSLHTCAVVIFRGSNLRVDSVCMAHRYVVVAPPPIKTIFLQPPDSFQQFTADSLQLLQQVPSDLPQISPTSYQLLRPVSFQPDSGGSKLLPSVCHQVLVNAISSAKAYSDPLYRFNHIQLEILWMTRNFSGDEQFQRNWSKLSLKLSWNSWTCCSLLRAARIYGKWSNLVSLLAQI